MDAALDLIPGKLHLVIAPRAIGYRLLNTCAARLALAGQVCVLDGGNGFDAHSIARQVRAGTTDLGSALQRITIARAFTCYQMVALLAQQVIVPHPLLVMDLLATFSDENVPQGERLRLLDQAIEYLQSLSHLGPVAVSLAPSADGVCLSHLETRLSHWDTTRLAVWEYEAPQQHLPPRLF